MTIACQAGPVQAVELAPTGLGSGQVAHWTFDEGGGTVAYDRSGNGRHATVTGGTWIEGGRFGGALAFDGSTFATVDPFPNATPSWTVSAWVRAASADITESYTTVISTEKLYTGGWELNLTPAPGFHFGYWIGPSLYEYADYPCPCLSSDQWTLATVVLDGATETFTFYRDGANLTTASAARPISPGNSVLYLGKWSGGDDRRLVAYLDDVVIYNRALLAEEVAALCEHAPPEPQ